MPQPSDSRSALIAAFLFCCTTSCDRIIPCTPASDVRFSVNNVIYSIPAIWQPDINDEYGHATPRRFFKNGQYTYCQKTDEKPAKAHDWGLNNEGLTLAATTYPDKFDLLKHISRVSVIVPGRIFKPTLAHPQERHGPKLFSISTVYWCYQLGTSARSAACRVIARGPHGEYIEFDIFQRELPLTDWPELFNQLEAFVTK